jgi:hypothetical protein
LASAASSNCSRVPIRDAFDQLVARHQGGGAPAVPGIDPTRRLSFADTIDSDEQGHGR